MREMLHGEAPGGGGKPQEIEGKGGENPPLCRNRVALQGAQSECQPWRLAGIGAQRCTAPAMATYTKMNNYTKASHSDAVYAVLAHVLASSCVLAQPVGTALAAPEAELPPITVSAHGGAAVPYNQTGASVTILNIPKLREEGISSVSEALTTVPGVYVLPGGGAGQRGNMLNLAMRGKSSGQDILPVMDGMRLYESSGDCLLTGNILARTNLFNLGTAEVLRGSQGAIYGSGANAGVVWMETPRGEGEPSASLFNEYGSFNSYTGNLTTQGQQGPLAFFLSATYESTENDIHTAPGLSMPDKVGRYINESMALRLDYELNKENNLWFSYRREDADYKSLAMQQDWLNFTEKAIAAPYHMRTNLVSAHWESQLSHAFSSSLMAGYFGADYQFGKGTYHQTRNVQADWRNHYRWCRHQQSTAGFTWSRSESMAENNGQTYSSGRALEHVYSLYAEHSITPTEGWENTLAARCDLSNVYETQYTLRAATSYAFNESRTRMYGSVAQGYHAPAEFQRMKGSYISPYGLQYRGNPALECETGWSADAGLEHEWLEGQLLGFNLFWVRTQDAITSQTDNNTGITDWENASSHQTGQGIELLMHGQLEEAWNTSYRVACTLTSPKNKQGQQMSYTARQTWSAELSTTPWEGFTTGLGLVAALKRTDWSGRQDSYYTLRWWAQYELTEHLLLHLRIENLTNQKFVTDTLWGMQQNISMLNAGTSVHAGCTLQF